MSLAARVALQQAEKLLVDRLEELRGCLQAEPALWPEFLALVRTLATTAPVAVRSERGPR